MSRTRVWIQGVGRSGTSWLQKIFDYHPEVFSLFEPESRLRIDRPEGDPSPEDVQAFASKLFQSRDVRAMRRKPILRKAYRSRAAHELRVGLIYGASLLERIAPRAGTRPRSIQIPDLLGTPPSHLVAKCVSTPYAMDAVVAANPDVQFIYIVRHPCGMVQSTLRGIELGKMPGHYLPNRSLLDRYYSFEKGAYGITEADFSETERMAYRWGVYNSVAYLAAQTCPNLRILRYEDLCDDPMGASQDLFGWVGLSWHAAVEAFLRTSLEADGDAEGYHAFNRNPRIAADKWKATISEEDRACINRIARQAPAAALFEDLS